jgi:hypothetical protein
MATEYDQLENWRNRLLNAKRQKESEIREIDESLKTLGRVPELVKGEILAARKEQPKVKSHNKNLAVLVRDYLAAFPVGSFVDINTMIEDLKTKGVSGKKESLYAYCHSLLKKESNKGLLEHTKGQGFAKVVKRPDQLTKEDTELVHVS